MKVVIGKGDAGNPRVMARTQSSCGGLGSVVDPKALKDSAQMLAGALALKPEPFGVFLMPGEE